MTLMRTHFEGTVFDNRGLARADAAAGAGHSPYRWRPLVWQVDGRAPTARDLPAPAGPAAGPNMLARRSAAACFGSHLRSAGSYVNERTVGVQQSAWAFVAQSRARTTAQ
jgi:hypothetical protein